MYFQPLELLTQFHMVENSSIYKKWQKSYLFCSVTLKYMWCTDLSGLKADGNILALTDNVIKRISDLFALHRRRYVLLLLMPKQTRDIHSMSG